MRRTDRLFEIIQLFRGGQLLRGQQIAEHVEVSLRTVYRDIETLIASGIPIEGERGVGYILREPIFLPPLMLDSTELEALQLGMEIIRQMPDNDLSNGAMRLLEKVNAVLPDAKRGKSYLDNLSVYASKIPARFSYLAIIRQAIAAREILNIHYTSLSGNLTNRTIRPLNVEFWDQVWTCTAWCELRGGFRVFRIDKINECQTTGNNFNSEPGKQYRDYLAVMPV